MLHEVKILSFILPPIVTHESPFSEKEKAKLDPRIWMQADNPDKQLDPDLEVVKMVLECLVLLCQRRVMREELRKMHVYFVVKNLATEVLDHDPLTDLIQQIVDLLMGEESNAPEDVEAEKTLLPPFAPAAVAVVQAPASDSTATDMFTGAGAAEDELDID